MLDFRNYKLDLGISKLRPEWTKLFSTQYLGADLSAGFIIAFVAIPLSLAIALASGVSPQIGLISAIVGGLVCAFFGGSTLSVSGPAAAMSVLIADIVEKFGLEALLRITLIAGFMQLLSGVFGLGRLSRYVPLPVISGFTAGIGVIILISQLPRAFGLLPPPQFHFITFLNHIQQYFHEINGGSLFIVVSTIALIRGLPRLFPRMPPILPAVALVTLIAYFFNLRLPLIGDLSRTLPLPEWPKPTELELSDLLLNAFTVYLLASLETLLSCSAVDKLSSNIKKYDSNQELIGQGLGNMAVALFGAIPVTSVIARSATNVKAGAKTRRSSIIHSLLILLTVFAMAPLLGLIPIAALAGVLFCISFSMINYQEFKDFWITSRSEALIYAVTFLTIISVDLLAGVKAGIIAAALIMLWQAAKNNLLTSVSSRDGILRFSLTGPLTFLSVAQMTKLEKEIEETSHHEIIVLDLSSISNMDSSGAAAVVDLLNHCHDRQRKFYIMGLPRRFEGLLKMSGESLRIDESLIVSEQELRSREGSTAFTTAHGRLVHGVQRFYLERLQDDRRLFQTISKKQNPHTLFITCSDSRMVPSQITSSDPGELFTVRNVGNSIPEYDPEMICSEAAALEFAMSNLDITDIVICGHANCGAIRACQHPESVAQLPQLASWINMIRSHLTLHPSMDPDQVARLNVLAQVENLKQYPLIKEKLDHQSLNIHAWFFDLDKNLMYEWDEKEVSFKPLVSS